MWFYGLLFASPHRSEGEVKAWSALAALVGAGVASPIPAGGAITPVALA